MSCIMSSLLVGFGGSFLVHTVGFRLNVVMKENVLFFDTAAGGLDDTSSLN